MTSMTTINAKSISLPRLLCLESTLGFLQRKGGIHMNSFNDIYSEKRKMSEEITIVSVSGDSSDSEGDNPRTIINISGDSSDSGGDNPRTIISISGDSSDSEGDNPRPTKPTFFACYVLCSLRPRCKATYIGFTVNPRRRIRQHNGVIKKGAHRTKNKQPWEMVLCVYGFPSKVSALKFEWAWKHPTQSVAVKQAAACLKSSRGIARKIELVYTMLTLTEWKDLNLTVNFLSTKHIKHTKGCPPLPSHMKVQICPMDEFPCYKGTCGSSKGEHLSSGSGPEYPEKAPQMFNGEMHQNISTDLVNKKKKTRRGKGNAGEV